MKANNLRRAGRAFSLLLLSSAVARAAGAGSPSDAFMSSRPPKTDFYLYSGLDRVAPDDGNDAWWLPVDLRAITSYGLELGVDTALNEDLDVSDTTVRVAQHFHFLDLPALSYLTLEAGRVLSTAQDKFESDINWTLGARAQGGWTRLGYNLSVAYLDVDAVPGLGDHGLEGSIGYRGQFGRNQVGFDYTVRTRDGARNLDSLSLIGMRSSHHGDSFYVFAEYGLADQNKGWYGGFGYEMNLGYGKPSF